MTFPIYLHIIIGIILLLLGTTVPKYIKRSNLKSISRLILLVLYGLLTGYLMKGYLYPKQDIFKNTTHHALTHLGFTFEESVKLVDSENSGLALWPQKQGRAEFQYDSLESSLEVQHYFEPFYASNFEGEQTNEAFLKLLNNIIDVPIKNSIQICANNQCLEIRRLISLDKSESPQYQVLLSNANNRVLTTDSAVSFFNKEIKSGFPVSDIAIKTDKLRISQQFLNLLDGCWFLRDSIPYEFKFEKEAGQHRLVTNSSSHESNRDKRSTLAKLWESPEVDELKNLVFFPSINFYLYWINTDNISVYVDNVQVNKPSLNDLSTTFSLSGDSIVFFSGLGHSKTDEYLFWKEHSNETSDIGHLDYLFPKFLPLKEDSVDERLLITSSLDFINTEEKIKAAYFYDFINNEVSQLNIRAKINYLTGPSTDAFYYKVLDYNDRQHHDSEDLTTSSKDVIHPSNSEFKLKASGINSFPDNKLSWDFKMTNFRKNNSLQLSSLNWFLFFIAIYLLVKLILSFFNSLAYINTFTGRLSINNLINNFHFHLGRIEFIALLTITVFFPIRMILLWRMSTFLPLIDVSQYSFCTLISAGYENYEYTLQALKLFLGVLLLDHVVKGYYSHITKWLDQFWASILTIIKSKQRTKRLLIAVAIFAIILSTTIYGLMDNPLLLILLAIIIVIMFAMHTNFLLRKISLKHNGGKNRIRFYSLTVFCIFLIAAIFFSSRFAIILVPVCTLFIALYNVLLLSPKSGNDQEGALKNYWENNMKSRWDGNIKPCLKLFGGFLILVLAGIALIRLFHDIPSVGVCNAFENTLKYPIAAVLALIVVTIFWKFRSNLFYKFFIGFSTVAAILVLDLGYNIIFSIFFFIFAGFLAFLFGKKNIDNKTIRYVFLSAICIVVISAMCGFYFLHTHAILYVLKNPNSILITIMVASSIWLLIELGICFKNKSLEKFRSKLPGIVSLLLISIFSILFVTFSNEADDFVSSKPYLKYRAEIQKSENKNLNSLVSQISFDYYKQKDIIYLLRSAHNYAFIDFYLKKSNVTSFTLQPHYDQGSSYTTQTTDLVTIRYLISEHGILVVILLMAFLFTSFFALILIPTNQLPVEITRATNGSKEYNYILKLLIAAPYLLMFVTAVFVFLTSTNKIMFFGQDFPFLSITSKLTVVLPLCLLSLSYIMSQPFKASEDE